MRRPAKWALFRYLDERTFTFDEREIGEYGGVELVLRGIAGRWLTVSRSRWLR